MNVIDLLWSFRNRKVHEQKTCDASVLAISVCRLSLEHQRAWKGKLDPSIGQIWQPPPIGVMKVNVDVAGQENFTVVAAIIRDFHGRLQGFKIAWIGAVVPLVGEAEAARFRVNLVVQMGYSKIILEDDSEIVILALKQFPMMKDWKIHSTIMDIYDSVRKLRSCQFCHVRRGEN